MIAHKFLITLLVILFTAGLRWAQSSIYTANLDSIVVQVTRQDDSIELIPFSVEKVDSLALSYSNNLMTVKEIFYSVPGIQIDNRFNPAQGDKIIIRGIGARAQFGTRGIKILLDNIPLTFPDGQSQLNNLDPANIGSVEILRGPASSLYGNASGGVIDIKSKIDESDQLTISPSANIGSYGLKRYDLAASGQLFMGNFSANVFTSSSTGFRENSEAKYSGLNFITKQKINEQLSTSFITNYFSAPYLLNPSSLNKSDAQNNPEKARGFIVSQGAGKKVDQFQTGISVNYKPSLVAELNTTFYGIWRSLFNPIPNRIIELDRFAYGIRSTLSYKPIKYSSIKFLFGFDYEAQNDDRVEFENNGLSSTENISADKIFDKLNYGDELQNQNESVTSSGLFAKVDYSPFRRLNISGGLRYDYFRFEVDDNFMNDNSDDSGNLNLNKISPTIGTSYKFIDQLILFSSYSTSFQTPTTNELSNKPDGSGGFNESLKPETIESYELGLRGSLKKLKITYHASIYKMFIDNMILPYENQFEETYYRNSGRTINKGLELFLKWRMYKIVSAILSYTYQDFKFDDFIAERSGELAQLKGNYVPAIPKHLFNVRIQSQLFKGFSSQININAQSEVFTNDFNGPAPGSNSSKYEYTNDGYLTVGIRLAYLFNLSFGNINISAGIENLFDKRYNASIVPNAFGNNFFEPAAGRSFYGSVSLNLL